MKKERLTILADPVADKDVIEHLQSRGVSNEGRRVLNLIMMLNRADLLEPLLYVMETGVEQKQDSMSAVNMALQMAAMVRGKDKPPAKTPEQKPVEGGNITPVPKPAKPKKLDNPFAAGSRS